MLSSKRKERVFKGLSVAPGIVIGPAYVHESGVLDVPVYSIAARRAVDEVKRLTDAVGRSKEQVAAIKEALHKSHAGLVQDMGYLLDAYISMLSDSRLVRGAEQRINEEKINAEAALSEEITAITETFAAMEDGYMAARAEDIREVGNRVIRNLGKPASDPFAVLPKGSVMIADELTPADAALLDPKRIAGFATVMGGAEGHTAIMARALELPAVTALPGLLTEVHQGDVVIIDGNGGKVIVNPTKATTKDYARRIADTKKAQRRLTRFRSRPAVTEDDVRITLQANIELPVEMDAVIKSGAEGIGLLRTEFMFMNREKLPGEDEQAETLAKIFDQLDGKPVTVRTLDLGGEKMPRELLADIGTSANSALGMRGFRINTVRPDLIETQMRAILRATAMSGTDSNGRPAVRVLLPMIGNIKQIQLARRMLEEAGKALRKRGEEIPERLPPLGVMIEIPSAALAADALARYCDFFAIGTNDLTMYTLAIDRTDEAVAHLYNPMHPAVLRLIRNTVDAAAHARIPISVCGEMAGDPKYTGFLVGLGVRDLSMSPANVPWVKQRIRRMDSAVAAQHARTVLDRLDPDRIDVLLKEFNALPT